jgi:hypothetical protein
MSVRAGRSELRLGADWLACSTPNPTPAAASSTTGRRGARTAQRPPPGRLWHRRRAQVCTNALCACAAAHSATGRKPWDKHVKTLQTQGVPLSVAFHAFDPHVAVANEADTIRYARRDVSATRTEACAASGTGLAGRSCRHLTSGARPGTASPLYTCSTSTRAGSSSRAPVGAHLSPCSPPADDVL